VPELAVYSLEEAAYLLHIGAHLRRIWTDTSLSRARGVHVFVASDAIRQARQDWLSGHALVDARAYARDLRKTRDRVYLTRTTPDGVWVPLDAVGDSLGEAA
jgi:hypothetical protein